MKKGKVTLVWDGQFGSTGKGQVAAHIQRNEPHDIAVRVGGPNAGHTFFFDGQKIVVQSIPVAAMMGAHGIIGPAGLILEDLLVAELKKGYEVLGRPVSLMIDGNAAVILPEHMQSEEGLMKRIGSTGEGVGSATVDKIWRKPDLTIKSHWEEMMRRWGDDNNAPWAEGTIMAKDTPQYINGDLLRGNKVMLEGTQGFGLSLHTGGYYPYCTSRECTPQALLAETGTGVHNADVVESIMVLRTYPIRVGGNSGPLPGEISWDELSTRTNGYVSNPEITTVTKKIRRIAEFDWELVHRAIQQCGPTGIALMFLDYKFPSVAGMTEYKQFPDGVRLWLNDFEQHAGVPVQYVGTGQGVTVTR